MERHKIDGSRSGIMQRCTAERSQEMNRKKAHLFWKITKGGILNGLVVVKGSDFQRCTRFTVTDD